jgi:dipeptidase D
MLSASIPASISICRANSKESIMSYRVDDLEPKALWRYFGKMCEIPHGSGNEKALGEAIVGWVREKGFEADVDDVGNIVARIPASPGLENTPTIVLQGHIDMVCEKNSDTEFDFKTDSLRLKRDGDWLTADGTTLGADNGIGVATGLAFIDLPDAVHGPLEILMTIDEERGLVGALNLEEDFIKGRMLFNLDSEEDGVFYVGCAGGRDAALRLPITRCAAKKGLTALEITVKGLRGGHSGMDIIHNRGNAINLVSRALREVSKQVEIELVSIDGGDKHNAIPRETKAVFLAAADKLSMIQAILDTELGRYREEFASAEPDLTMTLMKTETPAEQLDPAVAERIINLLLCLPHGVLAMNREVPGMVETSSNLARVRTEATQLSILTSTRSSTASSTDGVVAGIEAAGRAAGCDLTIADGYPGWKPNLDSPMLKAAEKIWPQVHGNEPKFEVIHAGLECGILGRTFKDMDMISLGPTIENPHSPDERVHVPSVARFFDFVKAYLAALAESKA